MERALGAGVGLAGAMGQERGAGTELEVLGQKLVGNSKGVKVMGQGIISVNLFSHSPFLWPCAVHYDDLLPVMLEALQTED